MSNKTLAIIQARMGSSRFPGKMLEMLGQRPLFEWVVIRLMRAKRIDEFVLATSDSNQDLQLVESAKSLGLEVFQGNEVDVLGRFVGAANKFNAQTIVRVCADNPFIDPAEIDTLVEHFENTKCDYAFNHQNRLNSGHVDGFGAEILSLQVLKEIASKATTTEDREHVTKYIWENRKDFQVSYPKPCDQLSFPDLCFDVNTTSDLEYLNDLVYSGITEYSPAKDIVANSLRYSDNKQTFRKDLEFEINELLTRLFPLARSITGEPNRQTLRIIREVIPIKIKEVPSGTKVFDWIIPQEWKMREGWIETKSGERVVDYADNNLQVVSYSDKVNKKMKWDELKQHLHKHAKLPQAIPYRTTYYNKDWGFCVTHDQFEKIESEDDELTVYIDSEFIQGSLSYGELLIPGKSPKEILLSCYICHPSMANDSLSGVVLSCFLARHIMQKSERRWSYRILFVPETIGAIAYCALNQEKMRKVECGLVVTTVGGPGKFSYKQSFEPKHPINRIIESVFTEMDEAFWCYPFDIHGSDERQYSSQGFRINVASVCKDRYYKYPYYHTSLDNLDFVTASNIFKSFEVYIKVIDNLESQVIFRNLYPNCEVMLSRHGLYPSSGGDQLPSDQGQSDLDLTLWILFLSDGRLSVDDIAHELKVGRHRILQICNKLVGKGILERV